MQGIQNIQILIIMNAFAYKEDDVTDMTVAMFYIFYLNKDLFWQNLKWQSVIFM